MGIVWQNFEKNQVDIPIFQASFFEKKIRIIRIFVFVYEVDQRKIEPAYRQAGR
jgi:hypothetical protein